MAKGREKEPQSKRRRRGPIIVTGVHELPRLYPPVSEKENYVPKGVEWLSDKGRNRYTIDAGTVLVETRAGDQTTTQEASPGQILAFVTAMRVAVVEGYGQTGIKGKEAEHIKEYMVKARDLLRKQLT